MTQADKYTIQFANLSTGKQEFTFKVKDSFFEQFENSEIRKGSFTVQIELQKQTTMLLLGFKIKGKAVVECDRCGDEFPLSVTGEQHLIVKVGGEDMDDNDEIVSVPSSSNEMDVSQFIYEYIILSLPLRRTHPGKKGKNACNPEVIKKLEAILTHKDEESGPMEDPRWMALKNIKLS
jgi:uncharacterized metal-binding protein YceD (DUF177 family)